MANYQKTLLIYNPRAGRFTRKGDRLITRAREILERAGHQVLVRPTTGPGTAGAIARAGIQEGADLVLAAGGDGTINETAEGLVGSQVPLGILPAGTANVLATEMRLGGSWEDAARRVAGCRPHRIAVGYLQACGRAPRHFLLMAGAGLDAHVVYRVNPRLKARTGKFAYWVAGWSLVGRALPQIRATVDGNERECSFALVARVRNYGGDFEIARDTTLFDETFEVVLFEGRNAARYVKYFAGMATNRLRGMSGVEVMRAREISLEPLAGECAYLQIDGEFAGPLPAMITIIPNALTLLMPPAYCEACKLSVPRAR